MLIAHLPAGYLTTTLCTRLLRLPPATRTTLILTLIGVAASVAPDLDMFWYYFVDHRQVFHHDYVTHTPLFWASVSLLIAISGTITRSRATLAAAILILAGSFTHLLLDSVVSTIHWAWPSRSGDVWLIHLPHNFDWWVWNYVFYWTFLLELSICLSAAWLFLKRRKEGVRPLFLSP